MSLFRTIMDKMSGDSYGKVEDQDLNKVIAERDALKVQLETLSIQYETLFKTAQHMLASKDQMLTAAEVLIEENRVLRAILTTHAVNDGIKN